MQPPAMIALVPTATPWAPSAIAFAVSIPSLIPPIRTTGIPVAPISSSASSPSMIPASVGMPTYSSTSLPAAPVEPCNPSRHT